MAAVTPKSPLNAPLMIEVSTPPVRVTISNTPFTNVKNVPLVALYAPQRRVLFTLEPESVNRMDEWNLFDVPPMCRAVPVVVVDTVLLALVPVA